METKNKPKPPIMHCRHVFFQLPGASLAKCERCGHIIYRPVAPLGVKK